MNVSERGSNPAELTWVAKLPFVRDPVFLRQMALVFVLPLLFLAILLLIISWPLDREALLMVLKVVLLTGGVMLALYAFVILGILRGRQEIRYTLNAQGVLTETAGPLKHMNLVKLLLMLSGKPTFVGIGMITQGPQSERVAWEDVQTCVPDPQARTITLRKRRTDLMVIHCTEGTSESVHGWVVTHMGQ